MPKASVSTQTYPCNDCVRDGPYFSPDMQSPTPLEIIKLAQSNELCGANRKGMIAWTPSYINLIWN